MDEQQLYDRISDDVMLLGNNVALRFSTSLANKGKDGKRYNYHKEFGYKSSKYDKPQDLRTIRRSFSSTMSFEEMSAIDGEKFYLPIYREDLFILKGYLNKMVMRLTDINNKVYNTGMNGKLMATKLLMEVPIKSSIIKIEPIVLEDIHGTDQPAVRVSFTSNRYIELFLMKFVELAEVIKSTDFYLYGMMQINYLGRPALGTNLYEFGNNPAKDNGVMEEFIEDNKRVNGRVEPGVRKKQKSYFNKIDDL